jgi:hypothetical protein
MIKEKTATKKDIIKFMFDECLRRNDFAFDNKFVKTCLKSLGSETNAYDMTKVDKLSNLHQDLITDDWSIIHLGGGKHEFVQGIQDYIYHKFETIEVTKDWEYKASILNDLSESESAILSKCFNQKILHDFLYND